MLVRLQLHTAFLNQVSGTRRPVVLAFPGPLVEVTGIHDVMCKGGYGSNSLSALSLKLHFSG